MLSFNLAVPGQNTKTEDNAAGIDRRIVMGMTITEKILARAGGLQKVSPGDVAVVDVETACLLDLSFLPEGWRKVLKVADPSKVVIIFDHLVPAPTV